MELETIADDTLWVEWDRSIRKVVRHTMKVVRPETRVTWTLDGRSMRAQDRTFSSWEEARRHVLKLLNNDLEEAKEITHEHEEIVRELEDRIAQLAAMQPPEE